MAWMLIAVAGASLVTAAGARVVWAQWMIAAADYVPIPAKD